MITYNYHDAKHLAFLGKDPVYIYNCTKRNAIDQRRHTVPQILGAWTFLFWNHYSPVTLGGCSIPQIAQTMTKNDQT